MCNTHLATDVSVAHAHNQASTQLRTFQLVGMLQIVAHGTSKPFVAGRHESERTGEACEARIARISDPSLTHVEGRFDRIHREVWITYCDVQCSRGV